MGFQANQFQLCIKYLCYCCTGRHILCALPRSTHILRQQIWAGWICKSSRSQNKTTTRPDDFTGSYKSFKVQCQAFSNYFKQLKMKEHSLAPFMRPLLCCYQNQFFIIQENPKSNTRKPNLTADWKDYILPLSGVYPWNARTILQTVSDKYSLPC